MRRLIPAAVLTLAALVVPALALGHAELVSSIPDNGETVEGPVVPIVLTFSEALAKGSRADVVGPDGTIVMTLAPDTTNAVTMSGDAILEAGEHRIQWTSVAADGDILRGELTFQVTAKPTESPAPSAEASATPVQPSPKPSTSPSLEPSPTPSPSALPDVNGSAEGGVIIPIVLALVFVAGATIWVTRRRPGA